MILPIHKFDVSQNTTVEQSAVEVVCAWALSGQYGPGARMLYYVLVVLCIFARKSNWMRSACLAAALLVPAVAAIHAIILVADAREGVPARGSLPLMGSSADHVLLSRCGRYGHLWGLTVVCHRCPCRANDRSILGDIFQFTRPQYPIRMDCSQSRW
jgi:hypothetical protein